MNTDKLKQYAAFLRNEANKITDALFIENLITEIDKREKIVYAVVDRWLKASFNFPNDYEKDNCFDTYNRSFYLQIISKIQP